jgi:hypothetical protein
VSPLQPVAAHDPVRKLVVNEMARSTKPTGRANGNHQTTSDEDEVRTGTHSFYHPLPLPTIRRFFPSLDLSSYGVPDGHGGLVSVFPCPIFARPFVADKPRLNLDPATRRQYSPSHVLLVVVAASIFPNSR